MKFSYSPKPTITTPVINPVEDWSSQEFHVYCITYIHNVPCKEYVGMSGNIDNRLVTHMYNRGRPLDQRVIKVNSWREADGVEAVLHQLQRDGELATDYISHEFYLWHSLFYSSANKGYSKELKQKPLLQFTD